MKDAKTEKTYKFKLAKSLELALDPEHRPIFEGKKLFASPSVVPEFDALKEIVTAAGGELLSEPPSSPSKNVIVVANRSDKEICSELEAKGHVLHSNELILTGILRSELDLENHKL